MGLHWVPVVRDWRLNERHYGALQGLNKAETAAKHGEEQVKVIILLLLTVLSLDSKWAHTELRSHPVDLSVASVDMFCPRDVDCGAL